MCFIWNFSTFIVEPGGWKWPGPIKHLKSEPRDSEGHAQQHFESNMQCFSMCFLFFGLFFKYFFCFFGVMVFSLFCFSCVCLFLLGAPLYLTKNTSEIRVDPPCNVLSCIGCTVGRVDMIARLMGFCVCWIRRSCRGQSAPTLRQVDDDREACCDGDCMSQVFWSQKDKNNKKPTKYQRKTRKNMREQKHKAKKN